MAGIELIGGVLSSPDLRPCGLCGQVRRLTKAHVPPQVAGNNHGVMRAPDVLTPGRTRRPGTWNAGGLWVRGLCYDCNHYAGRSFDQAYAEFSEDVRRLSTPLARQLQVIPGEPPAAYFAPGLVSRCVLFGMFAIAPRLRILFPELAQDLSREVTHGQGPIRWPARLVLKVGRSHPMSPKRALLSSGIWSMRVLTSRAVHHTFADVLFPPLIWSLIPAGDEPERSGLGPQVVKHLVDASDWVNNRPDRTHVDLRSLTRTFPAALHPVLSDRNEWIELMTKDGSDADAVILHGMLP